jgi:hypothetical protein
MNVPISIADLLIHSMYILENLFRKTLKVFCHSFLMIPTEQPICLVFFYKISRFIQPEQLENILSIGGSAYAVMSTSPNVDWFEIGKADLVERVPTVILEASQAALDNESLIREAWHASYSKNPDYEKAVSRCWILLRDVVGSEFNCVADPGSCVFHQKNPNEILLQ